MKQTIDQIEKSARGRLEECGVRDIDYALNKAREEGLRLLLVSKPDDIKAWLQSGGDADRVSQFAIEQRHALNLENQSLHDLGRALSAYINEGRAQ